jgi:hypothetical protein
VLIGGLGAEIIALYLYARHVNAWQEEQEHRVMALSQSLRETGRINEYQHDWLQKLTEDINALRQEMQQRAQAAHPAQAAE